MPLNAGSVGPGIGGSGGGGGGSGTVTSVSVVTANGLAGTVANPTTTPAITLSTSITGLIMGNGTALSAYTATAVSATGSSAFNTFELCTTGASNITRTLPAPVANGMISFKKVDSGAGHVVVTQHAAETIDGATTFSINTQYQSINLISDGTNWFVW